MTHTPTEGSIILVRHGQSVWNAQNRFTGWHDIELSDNGRDEARLTGERLKAAGITFDKAFVSNLTRAKQTLEVISEIIGIVGSDCCSNEALNERDYGSLTGLNKDEARQKYGHDQVYRWRRSYDEPPPGGESLRDTAARVLPYFNDSILPVAIDGRSVLVVAHGNSLRALVMQLERLDVDAIVKREIATGEPLKYLVAASGEARTSHI